MKLVLVTAEYLAREGFSVASSLLTLNRTKCNVCNNTTRSFVVYSKGHLSYNVCGDCHTDIWSWFTPLRQRVVSLKDDND